MRPKLCVVLSGGGSRGAFQVGVLKELLRHVTPDCIIGTSVGALNGAFVCAHESTSGLEHIWGRMDEHFVFPLDRKFLWKFSHADSIFKNRNLKRLVMEYGVDSFEDLKIPLHVNCTRLSDGKSVFFDKGPLLPIILASCAVVPFYPPEIIGGELYIDGGFTQFGGLSRAREIGARKILLVDSGFTSRPSFAGMLDITRHTWEIVTHASLARDLANAGKNVVVVRPSCLEHVHVNDFSHTDDFIREGSFRVREVLDRVL